MLIKVSRVYIWVCSLIVDIANNNNNNMFFHSGFLPGATGCANLYKPLWNHTGYYLTPSAAWQAEILYTQGFLQGLCNNQNINLFCFLGGKKLHKRRNPTVISLAALCPFWLYAFRHSEVHRQLCEGAVSRLITLNKIWRRCWHVIH